MPNFFLDSTQISIDWSVRTALYVSTELFSWEATSLKKNTFPFVFHILGRKLSGFRQNYSSTVIKSALVPRFSIGFKPLFSDFTQFYIDWSVRTTLYVSTGLFSWEANYLKKNTFQLIFHIWAKTFRVFVKFFPAR